MDLTERELEFLKEQGISEDDILDARRISVPKRRELAKLKNKRFIVGTDCNRGGHRLRTVAGHCIQCNTSNIAYQTRYRSKGCVYVAYSKIEQLVKIGCTEDPDHREQSLRAQEYGGAYDWKVIDYRWTVEMGELEYKVKSLLYEYSEQRSYFKDGRQQQAIEIFRCSSAIAIEALKNSTQGDAGNTLERSERIAPVVDATNDMSRKLSEFDWSIRTSNCLQNAKIHRIGDLIQKSEADLLRIPNFGRRSLLEVRSTVDSFGLRLGVEVRDWH